MQLPADYHMHTPLCGHASGLPAEYATRALEAGLEEIGFSDHGPVRQDGFDDWRMRHAQIETYVEMVRQAQRDFPRLTILLGMEMDYLPGDEDWIREMAARHPWDYLIGSVHYVSDSWDVDNPSKIEEWDHRNVDEVWDAYFERLTAAAASGLFNIIGHADLVKKFRHYPARESTPRFERFLEAARRTGTALEINTSGLRKDCQEIYPSQHLLELAQARQVPITFGSDAHTPGDVGRDFPAAIALAREVGYTRCLRFRQRQRSWRDLP